MTVTPSVAAAIGQSDNRKLRIFVSYSRNDAQSFADELAAGLEFHGGFDVSLDRHSIVEGEDWRKRLGALIADADTVVFIVSPGSAASEICKWEVDEATRLSKRILPVLWVAPREGQSVPQRLAELNYTRFDDGRSFVNGLKALVTALVTDLGWLREHTRLLARAMEWSAADRQPNRMLLGDDIAAAKAWASSRPNSAPLPTDLHLDYINSSEIAENSRRNAERAQLEIIAKAQSARASALADRESAVRQLSRRTTIGLVATGGLTVAAAGLAYWGVDAEARFSASKKREETARANSREAAIVAEAMREDIAGQFLAYAAASGTVAAEGAPGGTSPYTATVLARLKDESVSFYEALYRAHETVRRLSATRQRPSLATDMNGDIYLRRQPASRIRHAVVVSNDMYGKRGQIPNVHNDAREWAGFLSDACGFTVQSLKNPTKRELLASLSDPAGGISKQAPRNSLAMLVYSGFGMAIGADNYINTYDADHRKEADLAATMLPLSTVCDIFRATAAASILLLDTNFPTLDFMKQNGWWPPPFD